MPFGFFSSEFLFHFWQSVRRKCLTWLISLFLWITKLYNLLCKITDSKIFPPLDFSQKSTSFFLFSHLKSLFMTWISSTMSTAVSSLSVLSPLASPAKGCSGNHVSFQQVGQISSSLVFLFWHPFALSLAAAPPQDPSCLCTSIYPLFSFLFILHFIPFTISLWPFLIFVLI